MSLASSAPAGELAVPPSHSEPLAGALGSQTGSHGQMMPSIPAPRLKMLDPTPSPSIAAQPFDRETAIRGVVEAVAVEGRHLDQLRQDFPVLWQAVMALRGHEMMRPHVRQAHGA